MKDGNALCLGHVGADRAHPADGDDSVTGHGVQVQDVDPDRGLGPLAGDVRPGGREGDGTQGDAGDEVDRVGIVREARGQDVFHVGHVRRGGQGGDPVGHELLGGGVRDALAVTASLVGHGLEGGRHAHEANRGDDLGETHDPLLLLCVLMLLLPMPMPLNKHGKLNQLL